MRARSFALPLLAALGCGGPQAVEGSTGPQTTAPPSVAVLGIARRVAMLDVRLAAGETFEAPAARCQDTLVLVREGEVVVAPEGDQTLALGVREAVRFGPVRPATARARTASRLLVAVTRTADAPFEPARGYAGIAAPPERCGRGATDRVERSTPEGSGPFAHAEGRLRVSIFLDGRASGGAISSLGLLEGTADLGVPRHAHEISDEVLFIESGEGTMIRGDERIPVRGPQFVFVDAGVPHAFERSGDAPLVAYQIYAPAGPEQRFRTPTP